MVEVGHHASLEGLGRPSHDGRVIALRLLPVVVPAARRVLAVYDDLEARIRSRLDIGVHGHAVGLAHRVGRDCVGVASAGLREKASASLVLLRDEVLKGFLDGVAEFRRVTWLLAVGEESEDAEARHGHLVVRP